MARNLGDPPYPIDVYVGSRVKCARALRGASQTALARAIGVTRQQLQNYEKGYDPVAPTRLNDIADFLKLPLQHFLPDPEMIDWPQFSRPHSAFPLASSVDAISNEAAGQTICEPANPVVEAAAAAQGRSLPRTPEAPAAQSAPGTVATDAPIEDRPRPFGVVHRLIR